MNPIRKMLIEKLVLELHLNVEERGMLGSKTVKQSEVQEVIKDEIEKCGAFPPNIEFSKPGESAYEGHFIKKTNLGCELFYNECSPFGTLRGTHLISKKPINDAIEEFLDKELHFDINGIKIEKNQWRAVIGFLVCVLRNIGYRYRRYNNFRQVVV